MRELDSVLSKINPFIPAKATQVGNVAHLTKRGHVRILALKLEEIVGRQGHYGCSPFTSIAPRGHGRVALLYVLAHASLHQANIKFSPVLVLTQAL